MHSSKGFSYFNRSKSTHRCKSSNQIVQHAHKKTRTTHKTSDAWNSHQITCDSYRIESQAVVCHVVNMYPTVQWYRWWISSLRINIDGRTSNEYVSQSNDRFPKKNRCDENGRHIVYYIIHIEFAPFVHRYVVNKSIRQQFYCTKTIRCFHRQYLFSMQVHY